MISDSSLVHGIRSTYKKGCRCEICRAAMLDYGRKYLALLSEKLPNDHPGYPHGTRRGYVCCKCEACRAANAAYKAPLNTVQRQSAEFKARQSELNKAYRQTETGHAKRKALHAERKARLRGVELTGIERVLMDAIYGACPAGFQVDHIIPLSKGGAHCPQNLQYLPAEVNNAKRSKLNFDCSAYVIKWQDLLEPSTTIPQGSTAKRPEVPRVLLLAGSRDSLLSRETVSSSCDVARERASK